MERNGSAAKERKDRFPWMDGRKEGGREGFREGRYRGEDAESAERKSRQGGGAASADDRSSSRIVSEGPKGTVKREHVDARARSLKGGRRDRKKT